MDECKSNKGSKHRRHKGGSIRGRARSLGSQGIRGRGSSLSDNERDTASCGILDHGHCRQHNHHCQNESYPQCLHCRSCLLFDLLLAKDLVAKGREIVIKSKLRGTVRGGPKMGCFYMGYGRMPEMTFGPTMGTSFLGFRATRSLVQNG